MARDKKSRKTRPVVDSESEEETLRSGRTGEYEKTLEEDGDVDMRDEGEVEGAEDETDEVEEVEGVSEHRDDVEHPDTGNTGSPLSDSPSDEVLDKEEQALRRDIIRDIKTRWGFSPVTQIISGGTWFNRNTPPISDEEWATQTLQAFQKLLILLPKKGSTVKNDLEAKWKTRNKKGGIGKDWKEKEPHLREDIEALITRESTKERAGKNTLGMGEPGSSTPRRTTRARSRVEESTIEESQDVATRPRLLKRQIPAEEDESLDDEADTPRRNVKRQKTTQPPEQGNEENQDIHKIRRNAIYDRWECTSLNQNMPSRLRPRNITADEDWPHDVVKALYDLANKTRRRMGEVVERLDTEIDPTKNYNHNRVLEAINTVSTQMTSNESETRDEEATKSDEAEMEVLDRGQSKNPPKGKGKEPAHMRAQPDASQAHTEPSNSRTQSQANRGERPGPATNALPTSGSERGANDTPASSQPPPRTSARRSRQVGHDATTQQPSYGPLSDPRRSQAATVVQASTATSSSIPISAPPAQSSHTRTPLADIHVQFGPTPISQTLQHKLRRASSALSEAELSLMRAQHVRERVICQDIPGNRHNMHAQVGRRMDDVARLWKEVGKLDGEGGGGGDEDEDKDGGDDDENGEDGEGV